jgi:hypothetical protein
MNDDPDATIARLVASIDRGSIIAAAGCGKTEQIARAAGVAQGRRLILTHTHAGVDALRSRLKKHLVSNSKYRIDTIAGWCLWYAVSFPKQSGLACHNPRTDKEWNSVYEATTRLIENGAVKGILTSSYSGVFVDEYQDCTDLQHQVIKAIATYLPVCIFGDPLQAIFDFKGQKPVDWESDVFPIFRKAGELVTPWRWNKAGNHVLAKWLADVRGVIQSGGPINLKDCPGCVTWIHLPDDPRFRQSKIIGTCKDVMGRAGDGRIVVIGDPANINSRAALAQSLAAVGFSNIEPLTCKHLYDHAERIGSAKGFTRLESALAFVSACMIGTEKTEFVNCVKARQHGKKPGAAKFGNLITTGIAVAEGEADDDMLELLEGFYRKETTRLSRPGMFFPMRSGLQARLVNQHIPLSDAICEAQNRIRHAGRKIGRRSIGSTLLVKGLEFDHGVIVHASNMTRRDWYVALTRATTSLTVLSPSECIIPK